MQRVSCEPVDQIIYYSESVNTLTASLPLPIELVKKFGSLLPAIKQAQQL